MTWTLRYAHWTLVVISSLLLALPATSTHQKHQAEDSCVLPYLGPTRGGHPAQELNRIVAVNYKDCLHQCCQRTDGQCNVLLFSPPENGDGGSIESSCVLYHCQNLTNCNISARPGDQVFAEAQFVRQLLINTFNGHQSYTGKAPSSTSTSPPEHRDVTLEATKTPAGSEHSVPVKTGSGDSSPVTTPHADKTLSKSGALKDSKDSDGFTTRESTVTKSGNAQTGATTHKGSLVPLEAGTTEPQSGSGRKDGMATKSPSSETGPPKANTGAGNGTQTSSLSSSKLAGNGKTGTSGVQSSTKQSGISDVQHTIHPTPAKAATPKANSLTQSGNGSPSHSSVTLKTNSVVSGLTVAQTERQTTPKAKKNPASGVTGKSGLISGVTLKPGGSTPQANVLQTTQRETNATTLPAKSGSSVHPNSTGVSKSHQTGSPSTVHNATIPGTSSKQSTGTSPSSGHAVTNSTSGKSGSSSAGSGTSSKPTHPMTGGDVTKMAGTERTPFSHNGTASNASLVLGQLSDNGNHTSTWKNVMADQSLTTMAILISALTLGCFFLLVTMVIVGKRLLDCWRNRKYSKINRDYLIDGMYDE